MGPRRRNNKSSNARSEAIKAIRKRNNTSESSSSPTTLSSTPPPRQQQPVSVSVSDLHQQQQHHNMQHEEYDDDDDDNNNNIMPWPVLQGSSFPAHCQDAKCGSRLSSTLREDNDDDDNNHNDKNHENDKNGNDYVLAPDEKDYKVEYRTQDGTLLLRGGCLHCEKLPRSSDEIQVKCDECQSFICQKCHWCHEFQANHEIRVCDRCDAFYCRNCDEMDQCDDCGEVVCASCSTLLSCKFCGGGLCEECATACGRCGIVLCSRDAKFAVDCDTCRLSYCLVCLASGSKDPCVRCGQRPSKRMEQLVHLRLKSIYKAFKQSSRSPKNNNNNNNNGGNNQHDPSLSPFPHHSGPTIEELEDGMEGDYPDGHDTMFSQWGDDEDSQGPLFPGSMTNEQALRAEKSFLEEKQKEADAAAEALLAELDEEEEAAKTKKSKKKRKKANKQKAKQQDEGEEEEEDTRTVPTKKAPPAAAKPLPHTDNTPTADAVTANRSQSQSQPKESKASPAPTRKINILDTASGDGSGDESITGLETPKPQEDFIEKRLLECVEQGDVNGIEGILFELKGVPGRAALRKNAKKALKKLRNPTTESAAVTPTLSSSAPVSGTSAVSAAAASTAATTTKSKGPMELLKLISDNKLPGKHPNRNECLMQMSPVVVGWVIGKGGQRIRDLMEESGAKVWIDQEKAKPDEPRNVYISGERKAVDMAVRMVQEIVSKAPIEGASKYAPSPELRPTPAPPLPQDNPQEAIATPALSSGNIVPSQSAVPPQRESKPNLTIPPSAIAPNVVSQPSIDLPPTAEAPPIASQPAAAATAPSPDMCEQVMTCEARFVPLLIGKRGWAIKDIQDKSGARVDIDQTVTPRQIRISGSKASVDKAIPMVRDVLNYPHAQLQPGEEEEEELQGLMKVPPTGNTEMEVVVAKLEDRSQSPPPPSAYVMTGDSKSMISASSSLSSTPEPSMASSHMKVFPQHLTKQSIPPPDFALNGPAQLPGPSPQAGLFPQDRSNRFLQARQVPPPSAAAYGSGSNGLMGVHHAPGMGMAPHGNPEHAYNQIPKHSPLPHIRHDMLRGQQQLPAGFHGGAGAMQANMKTPPHGVPSGLNFARMGHLPNNPNLSQMPLLQQQHMRSQRPLGHYGSMQSPPTQHHNVGSVPGMTNNQSDNVSGLWNPSRGPIPAANTMPPAPGLGGMPVNANPHYLNHESKFVRSLHTNGGFSGEENSKAMGGRSDMPLAENFGLSQSVPSQSLDPFGNSLAKSGGANPRSLQDDSRIIDSLFGPPGGLKAKEGSAGVTNDSANAFLTGLDGLGLGGKATSGGDGLWGTSMDEWNATEPKNEGLTGATLMESNLDPSLLAGLQTLNLKEDSHPPQSRFDWGASNA